VTSTFPTGLHFETASCTTLHHNMRGFLAARLSLRGFLATDRHGWCRL
jgi:hypothetical protein